MNLKKYFRVLFTCMLLITSATIGVQAEGATTLELNGGEPTQFVEIFRVENGVTYLPIRLAFNDFERQGYTVIVNPSIDYKNIRIAVIKTDTNTGTIIDRRALFINWADEITNNEGFEYGRLEFYQYDKDDNGNNYLPTENFRRPVAMNNSLIFSDVDDNGGQRTFMSIKDLNNMVQFLIDDANYTVKLK